MESSGVLQLYNRSIERHKIRYIPFIGDGDSSSYNQICIEKPYGPQFISLGWTAYLMSPREWERTLELSSVTTKVLNIAFSTAELRLETTGTGIIHVLRKGIIYLGGS